MIGIQMSCFSSNQFQRGRNLSLKVQNTSFNEKVDESNEWRVRRISSGTISASREFFVRVRLSLGKKLLKYHSNL